MEELFIPNPNFQVFREDGKITIYKRYPKVLYKEIKDRYPTDNTAFAVIRLLKKFPILANGNAKQTSIIGELVKIASLLQPYSNEASKQINHIINEI